MQGDSLTIMYSAYIDIKHTKQVIIQTWNISPQNPHYSIINQHEPENISVGVLKTFRDMQMEKDIERFYVIRAIWGQRGYIKLPLLNTAYINILLTCSIFAWCTVSFTSGVFKLQFGFLLTNWLFLQIHLKNILFPYHWRS